MSFVAEVVASDIMPSEDDEESLSDMNIRGNLGPTWYDEQHELAKVVVKSGYLWKRNSVHVPLTGHSTMSSKAKFFVLTTKSLDYYRNDKCHKIRGSYPLAVINAVEMDICNNSILKLSLPQQDPVLLMARNSQECKEWIQCIRNGISKWSVVNISPVLHGMDDDLEHEADIFPSGCIPKLVNTAGATLYEVLHGEFPMIKYARAGQAIPHERVFKIDPNNLQIMWRAGRREHGYQFKCTLGLDRITEVRCGQQTRNFNQFPYLEVEKQSFSLMFEKEQGEWSQLSSLDLICDSMGVFQEWKAGLKELLYGSDGKLPQCKLQELLDPLVVHLRRHWAAMENKERITFDQALSFLQNLLPDINKRETRNSIRNINKIQRGLVKEHEHLPWDSFLVLFNSVNTHPKIYDVYKSYAHTSPDLGMTAEEFMDFLNDIQKEPRVCLQSCRKLIEFHDEPFLIYKRMCAGEDPEAFQISRQLLSYQGFLSFLRSKDSSPFDFTKEEIWQDMDQPLSHYFINSSHNTYLTSHQLKGLSSCEAYIRALQQNCRCIELDCWDGAEEPIITHGMTLTTKIRFRDVLEVIKEYAFEKNPFPVILSLENHCSAEQQFIMANMFLGVFGDLLAKEDLSENNILPSPNQLLRKIILKGSLRTKKRSKPKYGSVKQTSPYVTMKIRTLSQTSARTEPPRIPLGMRASTGTFTADDSVSQAADIPDELVQIPLEQAMGCLIVYCKSISFKRGELSENCCEMHSFNEGHAVDMIERYPSDMIYMSSRKLLRTYPKGSRVDSSNYNPMQMWKAGIHMASINFQKPDFAMHINTGFFQTNGNCGYLLKPECLRKPGSSYHPGMTEGPKNVMPLNVQIEVLSAQILHQEINGYAPVCVEIESVGLDADCSIYTTEVSPNTFNPQFQKPPMVFKCILPEMCVIYFKILSYGRTTRLFLQNVISLSCLKTGLRYIPMKTLTGAKAFESGIFVRIDLIPTCQSKGCDLVKNKRKESKISQSNVKGRSILSSQ